MQGLTDKVVIVTGAGSGIGRETARRLSREGARVAVNDIDTDRAEETVELIEDDGGMAVPVVADVTDLAAVRGMVDEVIDDWGGVHVLVNNAGWDDFSLFLDQDPEQWDRIIDINLLGQINCARAVTEVMVDRDSGGTIVSIASDAGRVGSTGEAVYSGTKGGVIAFHKALAREMARYDITCNVIAPGPTDTPLTDDLQDQSETARKILSSVAEQIPLGRKAHPADIASAVAFMASDDASFVTGQVLSVSGGLTMV